MTATKSAKLRLAISTTLASGLLFVAAPAWAQATLPDTGHVTNVNAGLGGAVPTTPVFTPTPTPTGTNLQVDLRNNRTILTWGGTGFNIAAGNSVNFKDARATTGVTNRVDNIAVLNRDISGGSSSLLGRLTSDANVGVYVVNRNGIVFGNSAVVNTGALFASTSDITDDNDFLNGSASLRFGVATGNQTLALGSANITTAANSGTTGGRMGDLVLVGAHVTLGSSASATLTANGGDVAMVVARDVTIQNAPGSPLSMIVHAGSATTNHDMMSGKANVTGRNITVAGAVIGGNEFADMFIDGTLTATGAAQTDRGIVLAVGRDAPGVTMGSLASDAAGAPIGTMGSIRVTTTDLLQEMVVSASDVYVAAPLSQFLNIKAARKVTLAGTQVTLWGNDGSFGSPTALGVRAPSIALNSQVIDARGVITSTVGDITLGDGAELQMDTTGVLNSARDILATSMGTFGGSNVHAARNISLTGRGIYLGDATAGGSIFASDDIVGGGLGVGLKTVSAGDVNLQARGNVGVGTITSTGMVTISGAILTILNIYATTGVDLTAAPTGSLKIVSANASGADADVVVHASKIERNTNIGFFNNPSFSAGRDTKLTISGNALTELWDVHAGRNVSITGPALTLRAVTATTGLIDVYARGTLEIDSASAGANLTVSGINAQITNGATATLGDILLTGREGGTYIGSATAGGNITEISVGSSAWLGGNVTAGGNFSISGKSVRLGNGTAVIQKAKGAVSIEALNGAVQGLQGLQGLTLQSNSDGVGNEALTVAASGSVTFEAGSTLRGGSARQSDVRIRSSDGALSLGNIEARGLLGASGTADFTDGLTRSGQITTGAINLVNSLSLTGSSLTTGAIAVTGGDVNLRALSGDLAIASTISASNDVLVRVSESRNLTIRSGGSISGRNIALSAGTFLNQAGANALTVTGHWVVYANGASGAADYDGLDSANTPVWNASLATRAPDTISGNRYVFAFQPTLIFSTVDKTRVYGTQLTAANSLYTVSGFGTGVAGAFLPDTAASAFSGAPLVTSAGYSDRAAVNGGTPYATSISAGTLQTLNGYGFVFANAATVTVTPKALTLNAIADSKTYDGSRAGTGSVTLSGILFGDDVSPTGTAFTFADKNAGTGKAVTVTAWLTGAAAGNYTVTLPAMAVADIFKKEITGTAHANNKTYNGSRNASGSIALSGVVAGDNVGTTGSVFTFADKNAGVGKAVTVTGTTLSGVDRNNYTLTLNGAATATIFKLAITGTVTVSNKTYDGSTAGTGSVSLSGLVTGDDVSAANTVFTFADKNAGTGKTVTVGGTTLAGADADNYTLNPLPTTALADILKRALTITYVADSRQYDGTTAGTGRVLLDNLIPRDDVTASGTSWTFADKNAGLGKIVTVAGTVLGGADLSNYSYALPGGTVTADIRKANVRIDIFPGGAKTYDGTTAPGPGAIAFLRGVVTGEDVNFAGGTLAFASKNASLSAALTILGTVTLTGADVANYEYTGFSLAYSVINPKVITGTVTVDNKVYDGTRAGSGSVALSGIVSGDSVGTTGSVFTFADKNAGTGKTVTISGTTLNGADGGNYTLAPLPTGLADILKKALTGAATANSKTYDGTTGATGLVTLNGVVTGDDVGTTGTVFAFADKNAGTDKTVSVSGTALSGADAANYSFTLSGTTTADILKKALTGTITANGKTYDGTTAGSGSVALNGVVQGDSVGTSGSVFTFADKNAGTGKTVNVNGTALTGADAGNYTLGLSATATADILKKALTGSLSANSKTYDGTTAGSGTVTLNGVVSGDAVGTTGSVWTFSDKNAGAGKTVTLSGTTLSGGDAGNYSLTLPATAFADILKKALTGTVTANGKTYDGTTAATGTLTLSGVIAGDSVGTTGSVFAFADKNAGTGKTVTAAGTTLSGADAGNYTLGAVSTGLADILKKALTGTITANSKTYDGTRAGTGSIALSGVVSGDSVGTTGTVFTFADKNAGAGKTVSVTGTTLSGADAGNYTLSLGSSAIADILKKALTGNGTVNSKTYDGTTTATGGTLTLSGVVAGDDVGTSGSAFAFADKNAGTGKSVTVTGTALTGADAANYTLGAIIAAGDIFKKAVTGTITANGKTYDGTTAGSGTVTLSGVIAGDSVGTTGSVFTFADKNAGAGKTVTVTGTTLNGVDGGNYTLTLPASALADILRKSITGSITVNSRQYDGTTAGTGTVTLNGVVAGDAVGTTGTIFTFSDKNAGAGKTVTVSGTALNGADAGNYTLTPLPGTALGEILKRVIAVAADDKSKTDGDDDPLLTFTITSGSLVSGDAFSGLLTRAAGDNPGTYAISIGTLTAGSNYQLNFTPGVFTIQINPATQVQQTLKAIPLPSQIEGQPSSGSTVTIDKDALCGEDTGCAAQ